MFGGKTCVFIFGWLPYLMLVIVFGLVYVVNPVILFLVVRECMYIQANIYIISNYSAQTITEADYVDDIALVVTYPSRIPAA